MALSRIPGLLTVLALLLASSSCAERADSADSRGPEAAARSVPGDAGSPTPAARAVAVGDTACVSCHAELVESFHRTNHHRSVSVFRGRNAPEDLSDPSSVYNAATDLHYVAFARGDTLFQREFRTDSAGDVVHERVHAASRVIGSGNATRSYLLDTGGYVTEMPLTWYVQRGVWDMSPGYEDANDRFGRKINLSCMTCHNGVPDHTPGTQNHYARVPDGIGCARCHGPGGDHVALRRAGGGGAGPSGGDTTIVNPGRLPRGAGLADCQQCHLAGIMVFGEGQDPTTFRPGQELGENRTVFVPEEQLRDPEWVGIDSHPLRLARSACYRSSEMTCSTCHDPHRPAEDLAEDHYRRRCLQCHGGEGEGIPGPGGMAQSAGARRPEAVDAGLCTRPGPVTPEEATSGDCTSCHMSRGGTSDVPHVTFTDHWIRRRPGPPRDPSLGRPALESPDPIALVALQAEGRPSHVLEARRSTTPEHRLEEAVAYWDFFETMHRHPSYPARVVALARAGLGGGADRADARVALGRALAEMDSTVAAERALAAATARYPDDPWVHFWLGSVIEEGGDPGRAVASLRRAVELQPLLLEARVKLAGALYGAGRKAEALDELEAVVTRDPVNWPRAWYNLGLLRLEAGDRPGARSAFAEASRLDPDFVDAHVQLGTALLADGRTDEAEAAFHEGLVSDPADVGALGSMALLHLSKGDTARARALLRRVLELEPGNAPARRILDGIGDGPGRR